MALTDIAARRAKPRAKPYKLTDSLGLHQALSSGRRRRFGQRQAFRRINNAVLRPNIEITVRRALRA